jgi:uncharacterized Rmd1/YagE family protein
MDGEIIHIFVYNVGTKFDKNQIRGLLKNPDDFSRYEYSKPTPEEIPTFTVPSIFNLKDETVPNGKGQLNFKIQASVYTTGCFSIRIRHSFSGASPEFLSALTFSNEIKTHIGALAEMERAKVEKSLEKIKRIYPNSNTEMYRIYHIESDRKDILKKNAKLIAGLLIDEEEEGKLDDAYVDEVMRNQISYNATDIVLVGWESVVMIDPSETYEHELLITEIANVQLLQMRISHNSVGDKIKDTEKIMSEVYSPEIKNSMKQLKSLNGSLGEFYDGTKDVVTSVNDTISGFGEWYLLRLYGLFEDVFKIDEWRRSLQNDLEIIDKRRSFVSNMINDNRSENLEIIVIALIVLEIVLEVLFLLK